MGDPAVTEPDEVVDRERHAVLVGGAYDVDVGVVHVPSHHDQRHPSGQQRLGDRRAEHDQRVEAEVLQ